MNEQDFPRKICAALDRSPMSAKAEKRLAQAREAALAQAHFQPENRLVLAGHRLSGFWRQHQALSIALLALMLALLVAGGWQWQRHRAADLSIDAQLLADELPIEAFLTDRFDQGAKP